MSVEALCREVGMSRQNYYGRRRERMREQIEEKLVVELVQAERKLQPRLGGRKLWRLVSGELAAAGVSLGRDRFFGVLRRRGLLVERRSRGCRTTESRHGWRVYPNLVEGRALTGPHQVWVSDITYLRTAEGFVYLALVMDAWSRKIVGYDCSGSLEAEGARRALRQALGQLPAGARVVHHSDRGIQYCCREYVGLLAAAGAQVSMTQERHCYENGQAERLNGILKQEYGLGETLGSRAEAQIQVREAVALYNERRPHAALGYRFPAAVHEAAA